LLITYNLFHLWMRWSGLCKGYRLGEDVVEYIQSLRLPEWAARIRLATAGLLGGLIAIIIVRMFKVDVLQRMLPAQPYHIFIAAALLATTTVLLSVLLRKGLPVLVAIYLLFLPVSVFLAIINIFSGF